MPRKKLLVEDARVGLDMLRQHVLKELNATPASSYRDQFRMLARKRVNAMLDSADQREPATPHPDP